MTATDYYPGKKFSLPREGSQSVAALWKRFLALTIDWSIAVLISFAFFDYDSIVIVLLFLAQRVIMQTLTGMSIGQLIFGIQLSRIDGSPLGGISPLVRTVLICLVFPAIILDPDHRGLHDLAAKTIVMQR
ncbi:MAG: RDD family protein [Microbacteriaceae bacterium]